MRHSSILLLMLLYACSGPSSQRKAIREEANELLDAWHQAAAKGDKEAYFGAMDPNSVFIGTDPSERWDREAFEEWTAPHFEGDTAWVFHVEDRHMRIAPSKELLWFDERLDTWMGTCRGSGVLIRKGGGWRIAHYHLSKTVPNIKMDAVLELLEDG